MKSIIIIGAILMGGASIYGLADYLKADKKGELKALYREDAAVASLQEPEPVPEPEPASPKAQPVAAKKAAALVPAAPVKVKKPRPPKIEEVREFKFSNFSRGRIVTRRDVGDSVRVTPSPTPVVAPIAVPVKEEVPAKEVKAEPAVEKMPGKSGG